MRYINITEEDIEIINTVFSDEKKEELLKEIERARLSIEFNKYKSELIKKLAENPDVSDIHESKDSIYNINPILYMYNAKPMKIIISSMDDIKIYKVVNYNEDFGCISYGYKASNMKEILDIIDKIHGAIDIGII